jgi:hypothetical protein
VLSPRADKPAARALLSQHPAGPKWADPPAPNYFLPLGFDLLSIGSSRETRGKLTIERRLYHMVGQYSASGASSLVRLGQESQVGDPAIA